MPVSVFNKVKLATLLKKTPGQVFSCEFFKIITGKFFIKTSGRLLLNADDSKNPRDCWSKISFFSPLWFLILNYSILMDLFKGCKTFTFKPFTKERRNSSEFSEICALLSACFSCLIIVGKVVNLLLTFVICMIFFHVRFMSIYLWMK